MALLVFILGWSGRFVRVGGESETHFDDGGGRESFQAEICDLQSAATVEHQRALLLIARAVVVQQCGRNFHGQFASDDFERAGEVGCHGVLVLCSCRRGSKARG